MGLNSLKWRAGEEQKGLGLIEAVSAFLKIPTDEAGRLIDFGAVLVRGRTERNPSMILHGREEISVSFPPHGIRRFYEIDPSRIIFRDRFLLAYDKEAGIPSQQVPYDAYNNVFAALRRWLAAEGPDTETGEGDDTEKKGFFSPYPVHHPSQLVRSAPPLSMTGPQPVPASKCPLYAAIHHRLDRETSGVLLFALEKKVNGSLGSAFRQRRVKKEYLAWVEGSPKQDSWTSDADIGQVGGKYTAVRKGEGKEAQTNFRVLRREEGRTLVLAVPLTGRTHQIRIHLAEAGCPVLGDRSYGAKPDKRLYLHAWRLTLKHPVYRKPLSFESSSFEFYVFSGPERTRIHQPQTKN